QVIRRCCLWRRSVSAFGRQREWHMQRQCLGTSCSQDLCFQELPCLVYVLKTEVYWCRRRAKLTWMMLECLLPICRLDLVCCGLVFHPKDFVGINRSRHLL